MKIDISRIKDVMSNYVLLSITIFMIPSFLNNLNAQIELDLENKINDPNIENKTNEPHPAVINSEIYKDPITDQSHIFGEVLNNFTHSISFVRVYAAVYDIVGNVVVTDYSHTSDSDLRPGQKSGFWILIDKDIPEDSKFLLTSTFEKTSTVKPGLLKLETMLISKDPVKIVGTVTNLGTETATGVTVTGIFYDQNSTVVDTHSDYVNIGYDIRPGDKANFSLEPLMNTENHDKIENLAINVESLEYSMVNSTLGK